jgi:hypothetical protein
MSETKFTPGPWSQAHRETRTSWGYSTEVFTPRNDEVVATVAWYPRDADEGGAIGTYREANAHLIAAAPELYEALVHFIEDPTFQVAVGGNPNVVDRMLDHARAALAKARGDQ